MCKVINGLAIYFGIVGLVISVTSAATTSGSDYDSGEIEFFGSGETTDLNTDYSDQITSLEEDSKDYATDDPETMPQLFQGDIAVDPETYISLRLGVNPSKYPKRLWRDGLIPFEISKDYNSQERAAIENALRVLNSLTCIKFTPFDGEADDYLFIQPPDEDSPKGCWSYVGRRGGEQTVSLQRPDEKSLHCFSSEGRIMHELMHAIGIYHEQSRADRDQYVKIHWENIMPKFKKNFKLVSLKNGKYSFDYDYNSVMHYGAFYFSKKKGEKPTMTPLQPGIKIGQRRTISKTDCLKINELYGCLTGRHAKMYRSFCKLLGL